MKSCDCHPKLIAAPRDPHDLTHLAAFHGRWVALDEWGRVAGAGRSLDRALDDAKRRGFTQPTVFRVPAQ